MKKTEDTKKPAAAAEPKEVEITPLKNWRIFSPPDYDIHLVKDKTVPVPALFIPGLKTEGVIKG